VSEPVGDADAPPVAGPWTRARGRASSRRCAAGAFAPGDGGWRAGGAWADARAR